MSEAKIDLVDDAGFGGDGVAAVNRQFHFPKMSRVG